MYTWVCMCVTCMVMDGHMYMDAYMCRYTYAYIYIYMYVYIYRCAIYAATVSRALGILQLTIMP